MRVSYGITVHNEAEELKKLLVIQFKISNFLELVGNQMMGFIIHLTNQLKEVNFQVKLTNICFITINWVQSKTRIK